MTSFFNESISKRTGTGYSELAEYYISAGWIITREFATFSLIKSPL